MYRALATGHGGIDWAGLPLMIEWLGIDDIDALLARLLVLKTHRAPHAKDD